MLDAYCIQEALFQALLIFYMCACGISQFRKNTRDAGVSSYRHSIAMKRLRRVDGHTDAPWMLSLSVLSWKLPNLGKSAHNIIKFAYAFLYVYI